MSCVRYSTDKIYCFGGKTSSSTHSNQILEYTPSTDVLVVKAARLPTARVTSCAVGANSRIYCFGGDDAASNVTALDQVLEYNPSADTITVKTAKLPTYRYNHSCATNTATGKIYCFGGRGQATEGGVTSNTAFLRDIVEYTPSTNTIAVKSVKLPVGSEGMSCAENSLTNKIYCFGGTHATGYNSRQIVEYTPSGNVIATKSAKLPDPNGHYLPSCAANPATGKIYCFGGTSLTDYAYAIEYNPSSNVVATKSALMPSSRSAHSCATAGMTNSIYCFGGYSWNFTTYTADWQKYNNVYLREIFEYLP